MTREICDKYLESLQAGIKAKDEEISEAEDKLTLIELGDELPETAKPNLKDYIHKKVEELNNLDFPP